MRARITLAFTVLVLGCGRPSDRGSEQARAAGSTPNSIQVRTAPSAPPTDSAPFPRIDDARLAISGVSPGQDESQVRAMLGKPITESKPESSEVLSEPLRKLSYPDLVVELVGRRVSAVTCLGPSCATTDGIRVGDPQSKVERTLGPGRRAPEGLLTYLARGSDCRMTLALYRDTVGTFKLSCDQS